ncbi:toxin VasX [Achromobacter sp. NPDC058515]|uniref:toxin VasX n=1 Tax=Achromobacter sp. NPDC058515 TaxID=3346533 RepID=UPI0036566A87
MTVIAKTPRELSACTPSGSAQSPHNCSKVIPFFPLRYAVAPAEKGGFAYRHPNLERGFPALGSTEYVLRPLRDDDGFLYIHDPDNREQILCFVYRSPDGDTNGGQRRPAQFQRLQLDNEFRPTALVGELLAFPYIPAYDHDPRSVAIWFADTLLSPAKLAAFQGNTNGVRSALGTEVNLVPWLAAFKDDPSPAASPPVKHTLRVEDVADQQPVGLDGKPVVWSEYPNSGRLPTLADLSMAQGPGSARLAVVLHDPVGLLSELNTMVASAVTDWTDYNAQSHRALWVSKVADSLLDPLYYKAYKNSYGNDTIVWGTRGTSATGEALLRAQREADRAGNAARDKRRRFLDDKARQEYLENDSAARDRLLKTISQKTEPLWLWWTYSGAGAWRPALDLYDANDNFGFCAMRGAIARCVLALAYHEKGSEVLAGQLLAHGPTGVFHYAMLANPVVVNYVDAPTPVKSDGGNYDDAVLKTTSMSGDQLASAAMGRLDALLKSVPPDTASQQISQVAMGLLAKKGLAAPEKFPGSRYQRIIEVLDGSLGKSSVPVMLDEVPGKLRDSLRIKGTMPFRRTKLGVAVEETMPFFEAEAARLKDVERAEYVRGLAKRLSLWHGLKMGASTLGIWGSMVNLSNAVKRLGQHDGNIVAKLLDVGSNAAGTVASGYGMQSAMQYVARQRAILAGDNLAANAAKRVMEQADRSMIGAMAVSALAGAFKAGVDQYDARGSVRAYIIIDGLMQFSEAAVAAAYLFGNQFGGKYGTAALANFAKLEAGPVGLGLIAFDILRTLWAGYVEEQKSEQKITDWLAHCLWGKQPRWESTGEERLEFMRLYQEPRIETDMHFYEKLGKAAIPVIGPVLVNLMPARTITVTLPGWQPQASAYALTQYKNFNGQGKEQAFGDPDKEYEFGDPDKVKLVNGVGYITFETTTQIGDTVMTYWPNAFSDPEISFKVAN